MVAWRHGDLYVINAEQERARQRGRGVAGPPRDDYLPNESPAVSRQCAAGLW